MIYQYVHHGGLYTKLCLSNFGAGVHFSSIGFLDRDLEV